MPKFLWKIGFPRSGFYQFSCDFSDSICDTFGVFATDTDESVKEIEILTEYGNPQQFYVDITAPGGLTREPHDLDAGDWAYAVAVFPKISGEPIFSFPLAFFQVRIAGSSAEVINSPLSSSLASWAVAADLWTSTDDYFEFNPRHGIIFPIAFEQTGPNSFGGSVFPEPSTLAMLFLATCCFPSRLLRRTA